MITLALLLVPPLAALIALARLGRIYPTRLLAGLAALPIVLSVPGIFWESLHRPLIQLRLGGWELEVGAVLLVGLAVAALAAVDAFSLPKRDTFSAERQMGRVASLKQKHDVELTLLNHSSRDWTVNVRDGVPPDLHPTPQQFALRVPARSRATKRYQLRSTRRGAFELTQVFLRAVSRLRLWQRLLSYPVKNTLHVYPDMKQLSEYAVLARLNRLNLLGVRRTRRIGQDNEFERLRDYIVGDNYKHIDWRTTSRRRKLTVKEFQRNQSQTLVFMVDCGRMMTNQAENLSLLDHAFNAMLMLSYVALSHGDAVGLICFSDEIHTYVPPKAGRSQMNRLLHASFDRFPRLVESRYDQAFLYLNAHCRKRSLVIFISNVIDEVNSHQIQRYLANMVGRHLPMAALLRDRSLFKAVDEPAPSGEALYRAAAAADILIWRHQVLADLQARGVLSVDTFPEDLTAPLINRYLDVKARHLL